MHGTTRKTAGNDLLMRGAVTGLGLLNLAMAFWEMFHFPDTVRRLACEAPIVALLESASGEPLAVVEAMKMENVLRADRDGKVKKINAKAGDSLAVDAVILEFE